MEPNEVGIALCLIGGVGAFLHLIYDNYKLGKEWRECEEHHNEHHK